MKIHCDRGGEAVGSVVVVVMVVRLLTNPLPDGLPTVGMAGRLFPCLAAGRLFPIIIYLY